MAAACVLRRCRGIVRTVGNRGVWGLLLLVRLLVVCPLGCSLFVRWAARCLSVVCPLRLLRQSPARRMQERPAAARAFCHLCLRCNHVAPPNIAKLPLFSPVAAFSPFVWATIPHSTRKAPQKPKYSSVGLSVPCGSIPFAPALGVFHVVGHL